MDDKPVVRLVPRAERLAMANIETHALNVEALQEVFNELVERYKNGQTVQFAILEFGPAPRVDVFQYVFGNQIDERILTSAMDTFKLEIQSGEFDYEAEIEEDDEE